MVERARPAAITASRSTAACPRASWCATSTTIGEDWIVKAEVRQLCNFRQANLCGLPLPFHDRFDVIFLRNVMLYFSQETRRTLLAGIHRLLAPDGILFLGSSEQPADPSLWTPSSPAAPATFAPACRLTPAHPLRRRAYAVENRTICRK